MTLALDPTLPIEQLLMVPGHPMKADVVSESVVGGLLNGLLQGS